MKVHYVGDNHYLRQAVMMAVSGDQIRFQNGYNPTTDIVVDGKELTFTGEMTTTPDGQMVFGNTMNGRFVVQNGGKLHLENLWVQYGGQNNIVFCKEGSSVYMNQVVLKDLTTQMHDYPVMFLRDKSTAELNNVTLIYNDFHFTEIDVLGESTLRMSNSMLQECRVFANHSTMDISNCGIYCNEHNAINGNHADVTLNGVQVSGGSVSNNLPALYFENGFLTTRNSTVTCKGMDSALFLRFSMLDSKNDTFSSLAMNNSKATFENSVFQDILYSVENSTVSVVGEIQFLHEDPQFADLVLLNNSAIYGDSLFFPGEATPEFRVKGNSFFCVTQIISLEQVFNIDRDDTAAFLMNLSGDLEAEEPYYDEEDEPKVANAYAAKAESDSDPDTPKVSAREQLDSLIGLASVKREIDKMLRMVEFNRKRVEQGLEPMEQSFHSIFLGNPGTGKTTVARLIGEILFEAGAFQTDEFKLIEVSEPDLISQNVGGTAMQTLDILESARGGVLFIDEAYELDKGDSSVNFGQEAINTILKYMEDHRGEIIIIFAGYTKEMEQFLKTNPGLTSRVPNKFVFEDYTSDEIISMGKSALDKGQYILEDEEYYKKKVKLAYQNTLDHSNGRWVRNFNEKLLKSFAQRTFEEDCDDVQTILNRDIDAVLSAGKYNAEDQHKEDALVRLDRLIGIEGVKSQVKNFVSLAEFNQRRLDQGYDNKDFSLHSLFLGNPGTGKTTVARIVGDVLFQKGIIQTNKFIEVSSTELVAGYVGQTAIKTTEVLESALGGVLFIDEAYTLSRGNNGNSFGQEAIDTILKFMEDHRKDIVIIFAGYTKEMDEFLATNSGLKSRIPYSFDFEDYTDDEIVKIGKLGLASSGYEYDEAAYEALVKELYAKTSDRSNGRWIRNLNEKLIMEMSARVSGDEAADINTIQDVDFERIRETLRA